MSDEYECTNCGKILSEGEKHNFYDCHAFVKSENKYLKTVIKGLRELSVTDELKAANDDAERLAAELETEQNPGYSCQALRLHYERIKGG